MIRHRNPRPRLPLNTISGVFQIHESNFPKAYEHFREADSLEPGNRVYMKALKRAEDAQLGKRNVENLARDATAGTYSLTVNATPVDSRIRIMNIVPKYRPGIGLSPGNYVIRVDKSGFRSFEKMVRIVDTDVSLNVVLTPR